MQLRMGEALRLSARSRHNMLWPIYEGLKKQAG